SGGGVSAARDLSVCLSCQRGRTRFLRHRSSGSMAKRRYIRRSHSSRHKASGLASSAAKQIRTSGESQDRQGTGDHGAPEPAQTPQRGDRIVGEAKKRAQMEREESERPTPHNGEKRL